MGFLVDFCPIKLAVDVVLLSSMFVLLEGRTKVEAFVIGQQIADAVTNDNPKPVKLKMEKVNCSTFFTFTLPNLWKKK